MTMATGYYYGDTTGTSSSTTADTWEIWCDTSATSSTTSDCVWSGWVSASSARSYNGYRPIVHVAHEPTPEEREAARIRAEEQRREREERERAREAAQLKAEQLLREHISDDQRAQYEQERAFKVRSQTGRLFRIRHGWQGNVDELDPENEEVLARFCIHPDRRVPIEDSMLIQKIMLELDEARFMEIANVTRIRQPVAA